MHLRKLIREVPDERQRERQESEFVDLIHSLNPRVKKELIRTASDDDLRKQLLKKVYKGAKRTRSPLKEDEPSKTLGKKMKKDDDDAPKQGS